MAKITVIASNNMFGHYSDVMIRHAYGEDIHSVFPRKFDIKNMEDYIDPQSHIIIIVGHAFFANQLGYLREMLQEIHFDETLPFTEIIHVASFGAEIDIPDVKSYVNDNSITKTLSEVMADGTDLLDPVEFDSGMKKIIQALQEYHEYSFMQHPNSLPLNLKHLSDIYKKNVNKAVTLDKKGVHYDPDLATSLYGNMQEYVNDKLDKVEAKVLNGTVICLTYAEEHHNELANRIIKAYNDAGYLKVIVLIGKQTRGDDMFHIRVSQNAGLNAEEIAEQINDGRGNEHAATVFLAKPRGLLIEMVIKNLSTYL